ncbi:unnamed protein product [Darwinula stevensoni]|uniref:SHSP domain-containing protein n=1 Tax=Darwinula stevensoni TaxID=69355 RepID=A0A7R9AAD5_9CRUS|nr:unnamed protein product [Darwinula stevensoni]CAG0898312.1 unnamed protein product [Darwinula stevensoni]
MWSRREEIDPFARLFNPRLGVRCPGAVPRLCVLSSAPTRRPDFGRLASEACEIIDDEEKFEVPFATSQSLLNRDGTDTRSSPQVNLDVQHFSPSEIQLKTSGDWVVVEAKHDEKRDEHGWVSRHFQRRYHLPEGVRRENVQSSLSSDGILTAIPLAATNERIVPIAQPPNE